MKKYLLILITPLMLFAQSYMSQIEPYENYLIYSQASGEIVKLDKDDETKVVNKLLIKLDDELEQNQLSIYTQQLSLYREKLKILEDSYQRYIKIRGASQSDKDDKLYDVIELKISIKNLELSIKDVKNTIKKKTINVKKLYIKEFNVNKGDYVAIGTQLASAYDISKSKLVVYVSADDYKDIEDKKIILDDKDSDAKIEKIDKIIDATYVSAYKVTLLVNSNDYGKVVKIEFVK
jgi:multidrug efflux pump subunit AcrA (membrane-fusion protein)